MAKGQLAETGVGAVVLFAAAGFLAYSLPGAEALTAQSAFSARLRNASGTARARSMAAEP